MAEHTEHLAKAEQVVGAACARIGRRCDDVFAAAPLIRWCPECITRYKVAQAITEAVEGVERERDRLRGALEEVAARSDRGIPINPNRALDGINFVARRALGPVAPTGGDDA